jgi:hypothetical protein
VSEQVELLYRPATQADHSFIIDSWGSSYHSSSYAGFVSRESFHKIHRPRREKFVLENSENILVCAPSDDPWHIIGWAAYETIDTVPVIHYVYIKTLFKQNGIGKELINRIAPVTKKTVIFTHMTYQAAKIMGRSSERFENFKFVPHLF